MNIKEINILFGKYVYVLLLFLFIPIKTAHPFSINSDIEGK